MALQALCARLPSLLNPGVGLLPQANVLAAVKRAFTQPAINTDLQSSDDADPQSVPEVYGHVHSTESFSAVDGPGIRFLTFLQGCAMRCSFCSNPDTWSAHSGHVMSSKDIASKMEHVLPYLRTSGGGITCSGGEPLLQPHFVAALFREAHKMGVTTCLDTTGQGTKHHNWDIVLPHTDLVLFCIKHLDPEKYRQLTGLCQSGALKFAAELKARHIPYYARYVLIPGFTDSTEDLSRLAEFASYQPSLKAVELLPYHVLGKNKWEALNLKYPLEGVTPPSKPEVHKAVELLKGFGVPVLCDV